MFVLSEIRTLIRLLPKGFDKSLDEQLTDEINRKLANKVMINVGLCLSLHDILEVGESFLFPGENNSEIVDQLDPCIQVMELHIQK